MANASVISVPALKPREWNQGGTNTTEATFTSDGTIPVVLRLPSAGELGGSGTMTALSSMFRVRAWGRVTTAGSYNVTVKLYYGTSATVSSDTAIATTGVVSVATASTNWALVADLVWDNTSGKMNGWYSAVLDTTRVAPTTITNQVTSADPDANTTQGFVVSVTLGTGSATNAVYLDGFQLEF